MHRNWQVKSITGGAGRLIYMPEESTPTIATEGNRKAVAYLEVGEDTDYYGKLFAGAGETATERDRLIAENAELREALHSLSNPHRSLNGSYVIGKAAIDNIRALVSKHGGGR